MTKKQVALDDELNYGRPIDDPESDFDNEMPSDPSRYVAIDGVLEVRPEMAKWVTLGIREEARR